MTSARNTVFCIFNWLANGNYKRNSVSSALTGRHVYLTHFCLIWETLLTAVFDENSTIRQCLKPKLYKDITTIAISEMALYMLEITTNSL